MADQTARMRQLADTLNQASQAYYFGSEPIMSDMEWDKLYDELSALEKETGIVLQDSPTHRVGGEVMTAFAPHTHIHRLWSMDKAQSIGAVEDWIRRTEKLSGQDDLQYCVEYKFDGLTLNLTYNEGRLIQAATRGNGITGEAILPQAKTIRTVPLTIPYQGLLEVQGECIMRLSALDTYNKTAKEPLKNARNAAAGALRNLDPAVTASRHLDAFFYQIGTIDNPPYTTQQGMLDFLRANGFQVSPYLGQCRSIREIEDCIHHIEEERSSLDFLIDGVLIKVSDLSTREMMGYTDRFPRWAIAFKFEAEETTTVIRDVTWDVGRTGKLTPVAHVEPVDFYGVTVRKATLNNWGDIQRKRVAIGARVWIRRSNDVIPEIMGHVGDSEEGETPIVRPEVCPACGEKLIERGAPVDLVFQSVAGTEAANSGFGINLALLQEAREAALSLNRGTLGNNVMYFETGQGSCLSANAHHGVDQQTCEARAYAVARHFEPLLVNTVVGFIGPEYLYDGKQIIRAGLEDHFCGKLMGLPIGCDVCYTNHAEADQDDMDTLLTLLCAAGLTFLIGVPGADDIMLNYQSTSFHDALYARRLLGLQHAPEFADWLTKMQIIDRHGALRLTDARHPLLSVLPQGEPV